MTQKEIVLEIVACAGDFGIRTEQVKIKAMLKGCSCADRFLRWLQASDKIIGYKENGNRTKSWRLRRELIQQSLFKGV